MVVYCLNVRFIVYLYSVIKNLNNMTKEQFNEYQKLLSRANGVQGQLRAMLETAHSNQESKNVPVFEMGRLSLSYGNGSWNHLVLNNKEDVKTISKLIIGMLRKELKEIKSNMELI